MSTQKYHALALFSGGLDSILAIKTIEKQGLKVKCLHYVSPFFGSVEKVEHWKKVYDIDLEAVNIGDEYSQLLQNSPVHGYGSTLNPCVDCKILMMRKTKTLLEKYGAEFIISGEVLGQRPMSQRRDTLNVIHRDADVKDLLLRPLCAKHMSPTPVEESGLVNRELLHNFSGRGRSQQLELAKEYGIKEIPTPAGGCKLTEKDTSARYWSVLSKHQPNQDNFDLANTGRQFWHAEDNTWLVIGRNQADNAKLETIAKANDILLRVNGFPSPLGLIRTLSGEISEESLTEACTLLASYSPKAVTYSLNGQNPNEEINEAELLGVSVITHYTRSEENYNLDKNVTFLNISTQNEHSENSKIIIPKRVSKFKEPAWEEAKVALKHLKHKL